MKLKLGILGEIFTRAMTGLAARTLSNRYSDALDKLYETEPLLDPVTRMKPIVHDIKTIAETMIKSGYYPERLHSLKRDIAKMDYLIDKRPELAIEQPKQPEISL